MYIPVVILIALRIEPIARIKILFWKIKQPAEL